MHLPLHINYAKFGLHQLSANTVQGFWKEKGEMIPSLKLIWEEYYINLFLL